jgi:hypothetical protein
MSGVAAPSPDPSGDRFYTVNQLKEHALMPYHPAHIRLLMRQGKLPCRRLSARRVGMFSSDVRGWQEAIKNGKLREWQEAVKNGTWRP